MYDTTFLFSSKLSLFRYMILSCDQQSVDTECSFPACQLLNFVEKTPSFKSALLAHVCLCRKYIKTMYK